MERLRGESPKEFTSQRKTSQKEQVKPQQERVVHNSPISPVEQKTPDKLNPLREEGKEEKFEITEREKFLLELVADIAAKSYLPGAYSVIKQEDMKGILLSHINKITKTVPSEE